MRLMAAVLFVAGVGPAILYPQAADPVKPARPATSRVIGEVTAVDAAAGKIIIKTDTGSSVPVSVTPGTRYQRVAAGAKDLTNAAEIKLADLAVGDRVIARGAAAAAEGAPAATATSVIVMSKADVAKKQEADRAEWIRRGVFGHVASVDAAAKTITLNVRGRDAKDHPLTVDVSGNVRYRRYAPESVKFSDARPGTLDEIKPGDQLRALGEKNAEGTSTKAEEIISGAFRNIAAQVKQINAATGEIVITDLDTKKPVTIKVNAESNLRRMPEQMAQFMAMRMQRQQAEAAGGAAATGAGAGGGMRQRPEGGAAAPGAGGVAGGGMGQRPAGASGFGGPGGAGGGGFGGPGGGMRAGGGDVSQMLDRLPAFTLADLKSGDALIILSSAGSDATRTTAIMMVAGVEPLLTAPRTANQTLAGQWDLSGGMGMMQ
jgi:hypothetical protein